MFDSLHEAFSETTRNRGLEYIRRVRVAESTELALHAHVRGEDDYCVQLACRGTTLAMCCSCPYFADRGPCKHLWAVIFVAGAQNLPILDDVTRLQAAPSLAVTHGRKAPPPWRAALAELQAAPPRAGAWLPQDRQLVYVIDVPATLAGNGVRVDVGVRAPKKGGWSKPGGLGSVELDALPDPSDRELVPLLAAMATDNLSYSYGYGRAFNGRVTLPSGTAAALVERMCRTGRALLRLPPSAKGVKPELLPCPWSDGAYALHVGVEPRPESGEVVVRGELRRDGVARALSERVLASADGLIFFRDHAARLDVTRNTFRWIPMLSARGGELRVPTAEAEALVETLHSLPERPPLELPEALRLVERTLTPTACLRLRSPGRDSYSDKLRADLRFDYVGQAIHENDPRPRLPVSGERAVIVRDRAFETGALAALGVLGFRVERVYGETDAAWRLAPARLPSAVAALTAQGWRVEADGVAFRAAGEIKIDVVSGIDWFDVNGEVAYGELRVSVPRLLAAARRGERFVKLDDGSFGLLPEEWMARHRLLGELGAVEGEALRFKAHQIGLLDALLAALPEATLDARVGKARAALARFDGVRAVDPPRGFVGTLRSYQREGLGWLEFLRDFGFGGCLADDMGLGKTIQVLALLQSRRKAGKPSLVVVPKSLVFNWRREAARFTPQLRVLEHHGLLRLRTLSNFASHDVVVTTYGTLVRDAAAFARYDFDYAILDEAQAIKNPKTEAAKAARLLRADHRLVLTGTPVENRLSDLWSLFEFLNPGMLGASQSFKVFGELRDDSDEARRLLARALRPFILRRTKEQVATDLPPKTEQIIYCELEGQERKQYDELRAHYRATLLGMVDKSGIGRAQMHILEALLRLRQAACHPGLIDRAQHDGDSAKTAALVAQLTELAAEGHKAVVFSQFTSLLAIVKKRLDAAGLTYEYLDGRTRNRQAKVDRFQDDPACQVFLVSLKAGGVGLNLTAAEYVFLLDPWWNPAVEAQAVDRAHRIGQTRAVFAYRLIGRDTIEEKVLALKDQKRQLADAIINADNALLSRLDRQDLELLLS